MLHCHYPLQALLYSVVLHRYLRWRQPRYDPQRHLGGVLYLYVRGMVGPTDARRRRGAVRGLLLATAGGADRGAVEDPRRRCLVTVTTAPGGRPPADQAGPHLALRASGLLAEFNRAEVLEAADVHVARRLGALTGEEDPQVLLAVALAVRAARLGAVCVDLDHGRGAAEWRSTSRCRGRRRGPGRTRSRAARSRAPACCGSRARCSTSTGTGARSDRSATTSPPGWRVRPPTVDEAVLATSAARLFGAGWEEQRDVAVAATRQWTTVLTGGPGTGKTATVARLLVLVSEQHEAEAGAAPRIALAAPTGKAATRLEESVAREAGDLAAGDRARIDRARGDHGAPAPRLATRQRHSLPPPSREPAALRRRRGRRGVDGLAVADGPAAGGGASAVPAGAGRRSRPALLGRGGRGARRRGPRFRRASGFPGPPAHLDPPHPGRRRRRPISTSWLRRSGSATRTPRSR